MDRKKLDSVALDILCGDKVTQASYYFSDDEYIEWFKCDKCGCKKIMHDYNYCPNCGRGIACVY